jgi:hypothetical protein
MNARAKRARDVLSGPMCRVGCYVAFVSRVINRVIINVGVPS